MDHGHPYDQLNGPTPEPPAAPVAKARRVPRVAIGVGLTAFLGLAGAGLAFATSGGSTPSAALSASSGSSTTTTVPGRPARPQFKGGAFGGRFGGPAAGIFGGTAGPGGSIVHAQYTTKDGSGYRTIDLQTGQVTDVSSTSITVKSADGFSATYAVKSTTVVDSESGGISAVAAKDTVTVTALVSGSSATATSITDTTKIGASRQSFGFGARGQMPGAGISGAPAGPSAPA